MAKQRVIIVGGGVIGVCCAYFLTKRGFQVTLVERNRVGAGASSGNAGSVAVGHMPINKPGRIGHALRQLFNPRSAVRIPIRWDPSLAKWLWKYRSFCNPEDFESSSRTLSSLGHATLGLFDALVEEENLQCGYRRDGFFEVCLTSNGLEYVKSDVRSMIRHGYSPHMVSGEKLREVEPVLKKEILGGAYFPEGATCDPSRFVLEMARIAEELGARILVDHEVTEVLNRDTQITGIRLGTGQKIEGDTVVLTTGSYSQSLTEKFGFRLPVQPGKGYHRDVKFSGQGATSPKKTFVMSEASVFCSPMGEFTRFAGTIEFTGMSHELNRERLDYTTSSAEKYLHGLEDAEILSEWAGLRPCTPDGIPCVGPVPGYSGFFLATGHATLGLTLAPITGKIMEQCIAGDDRQSLEIEAMSIARFW